MPFVNPVFVCASQIKIAFLSFEVMKSACHWSLGAGDHGAHTVDAPGLDSWQVVGGGSQGVGGDLDILSGGAWGHSHCVGIPSVGHRGNGSVLDDRGWGGLLVDIRLGS